MQRNPLPPSYYDASQDQTPPPGYGQEQEAKLPSAPPPENYRVSYDQVVEWWNALTPEQCSNMQKEGRKLSKQQISQLKKYYKNSFPKDYGKEFYSTQDLGACDYFLIFYFYNELSQKYPWLQNSSFLKAFEIPPPPYQGDVEVPPPPYEKAENWWNNLPQKKQKEFQKVYKPEDIARIRREYHPYYVRCPGYVYHKHLDFFDYYLMSHYPRRLYFYNDLCTSIQLSKLVVEGTVQAVRCAGQGALHLGQALGSGAGHAAHFFGTVGSNVSGGSSSSPSVGGGGSKDDGKGFCAILLGILVMIVIFTAAVCAAIGAGYSSIKAAVSTSNLLQGKKILRSLWRLAAIAAGIYAGVIKGAVLGAMAGSAIPGVGTAAGAIVGMFIGAGIMAGLAAALAKHSARFVNYLRTGFTNDKWNVNTVKAALKNNHCSMSTREISNLLAALKTEKNKYKNNCNPFVGSLRGTKNNTEKNRYNKCLAALHEGLDPGQGIRVDAATRFRLHGGELKRENDTLPPLQAGLKC